MLVLVDRHKYPNLKAMCQVMLVRFLSERPYQSKGFKWWQRNYFGDTDLVTFNILVPQGAEEILEQVRVAVAQLYPRRNVATFLASAVVWWVGQHDAMPPELVGKSLGDTPNLSPYLNYRSLIALQEGNPGQKNKVQIIDQYTSARAPVRAILDGYPFTWGQIVERIANSLWIFDFYLEAVQKAYVAHQLSLTEMQNRVLAELELRTDPILRIDTMSQDLLKPYGKEGFRIIPGTPGKGMAFSVACLPEAVQSARNWLANELLLGEILTETERAVLNCLKK